MRNKLIDILLEREAVKDANAYDRAESLADFLLAKGVIALPCKVGGTVYVPWHWDGQQGIAVTDIEEIVIYDAKMNWMFLINLQSDDEGFNQSFGGWMVGDSIGDTVFLTREEAERALKGAQG